MDRNKGSEFEFFGELTTEDFQQKLYEWLEERGVLPGLRTYLRHQLISAIKNTHLSSEYLNRKRNHLSPKIQAINRMIAEYLLVQNYHYTVSVFHSEEPHISSLPKKIQVSTESDVCSKYFKERDVEDILESLNLGYKTALTMKVLDIYFNEKKDLKDTSLLHSLFQALENINEPKMYLNAGSYGEKLTSADKEAKLNHQGDETMSKTSTRKTDLANNHLQKDKYLHNKSTAQQESEFNKERNREELERRVEQEVKKLHQDLENEVSAYKKKLEEDFMLKQQQILEFTNILRDQQIQHQLHYEQIQKKEEILKEREKRLEVEQKQENLKLIEKQNEIIWAQQKLEEDFRRLKYEQNSIKFFQKEMEAGRNQITEVAQLLRNSQFELNLLQSLHFERHTKNEGSDKCNHQQATKGNLPEADTFHVVQSVHSLQEDAIQACQETILQLKDKNKKLQSLANEQQSKINALTTTALSLNSQIEEATAALRLLSSQDDHKSESLPFQQQHVNLPTFQSEDRLQITMEKEREAFNREKAFVNKKLERTGKAYPKEHVYNDYRHESDESVNSASSSPTEEILCEAKYRLELLKMESDAVDRQYFNFKKKHLSESGRIASVHSVNTVPQNYQSLEKEKSLSSYVHAPTTLQRFRSDVMPSYQLQQSNQSMQYNDSHREQILGHTEKSESFVNQLIFHNDTPLRNQNHISNMRQTNITLPSTSSSFHQATINSRYLTNDTGMGINLAVGGHKNNSQILPDLNAFNLNKISQPDGETKYGNTHFESNSVHNNRIKNDSLSIDVKENLHKFPIEPTHNKDGINHKLKENVSSMNTCSNTIIQNHLEKEKRDNTELENKNSLTGELEGVQLLNNKENTNKHIQKLPSAPVDNQESVQEEDADAAESQVSLSSLQESSSPKLSMCISENKDGGDDLW